MVRWGFGVGVEEGSDDGLDEGGDWGLEWVSKRVSMRVLMRVRVSLDPVIEQDSGGGLWRYRVGFRIG
jgi:hypothetical protein